MKLVIWHEQRPLTCDFVYWNPVTDVARVILDGGTKEVSLAQSLFLSEWACNEIITRPQMLTPSQAQRLLQTCRRYRPSKDIRPFKAAAYSRLLGSLEELAQRAPSRPKPKLKSTSGELTLVTFKAVSPVSKAQTFFLAPPTRVDKMNAANRDLEAVAMKQREEQIKRQTRRLAEERATREAEKLQSKLARRERLADRRVSVSSEQTKILVRLPKSGKWQLTSWLPERNEVELNGGGPARFIPVDELFGLNEDLCLAFTLYTSQMHPMDAYQLLYACCLSRQLPTTPDVLDLLEALYVRQAELEWSAEQITATGALMQIRRKRCASTYRYGCGVEQLQEDTKIPYPEHQAQIETNVLRASEWMKEGEVDAHGRVRGKIHFNPFEYK